MIGVTLRGGLGNQMFQFATAYALAKRNNTEVQVDTSAFWHPRLFLHFDLWRFPRLSLERLSRGKALKKMLLLKLGIIKSVKPSFSIAGLGYDERVLSLPDRSHIQGWFQSERYFVDVRREIRRLFDFSNLISPSAIAALGRLREGGEIVALHVRRGDYLESSLFKIDTKQYYSSALEYFGSNKDYIFLVFSDDVLWCRESQMARDARVKLFVDLGLNFLPPICEMALMSHCDHHIIANSTFSWWAAWLNDSVKKKVIMPKQWLSHNTARECGTFVPGWTEL